MSEAVPVELGAQVRCFYDELWNGPDLRVAEAILSPSVVFRGSLGSESRGREAFCDYVRLVTSALSDYRCDIVTLVVEGRQAAARMTFSGTHVGPFLGRAPTGKTVQWAGAAFFHSDGTVIDDIWVLGDLAGLYAQLDG